MANEILTRPYHLMLSDVDRFRRLRLSVLFRMFQDLLVVHAEALGAGRAATLDRGFLWIVSKVRLEFSRVPEYGEAVVLKTWPGKMGNVLFPRHYLLESAGGEALARASSLWALMDCEKRTPVVPKNNGISVKDCTVGSELPLPSAVLCPAPASVSRRSVLYSETDMNGHMNNSRYLDWADDCLDCLDMDFHKTRTIKSLQINFLSEAVTGTAVRLESSLLGGEFYLKGRAEGENGKTIFALHALYV
jgi:acyl-ACP thioesterase